MAGRNGLDLVSIPFKRESPFGPKQRQQRQTPWLNYVSIPFKRESPFGHSCRSRPRQSHAVSIPFKRESPFGPLPVAACRWQCKDCFNSLQTGKPFRTCRTEGSPPLMLYTSFNSLQTGKPFRTSEKLELTVCDGSCFNSLQTGKPFRTRRQ